MSHRPPQCTKQIFFFCLTKNYPTGAKSSFKYALNFINVTSRYNKAEPLTSKKSAEVAKAFQNIYKRRPMKWPQLLQVDPGSACSDSSMPSKSGCQKTKDPLLGWLGCLVVSALHNEVTSLTDKKPAEAIKEGLFLPGLQQNIPDLLG